MNFNLMDLLLKLGLVKPDSIRNAILIISDIKKTNKPTEAIDLLRQFGGEGWLCATDSSVIRRFYASKPLPPLPDEAWPIAAEAANGESSLHLLRVADGWKIATVKRHLSDDGTREVILTHYFRARERDGALCYEVAWKPDNINGLNELHPYAYRFLGFDVK